MFYKLLHGALVFWLVVPMGAKAADISHRRVSDRLEAIIISGDISSDDVQTFREVSIKYRNAVVILSSNGGSLLPAIEIGKIVKIAGYATLVAQNDVCVSSCALIWVAGSKRLLSPRGRVGFHASYRDNNGEREESGVANALVGNFLTLLNLPERAIIFATKASPEHLMWLTKDNKASAGIDFDEFDPTEGKSDVRGKSVVAPPVVQVGPPPPSQLLPIELREMGENWVRFVGNTYYDANSIRQVAASEGSFPGRLAWVLFDKRNDYKSDIKYSRILWRFNCIAMSSSIYEWIDTLKSGEIRRPDLKRDFLPVDPESATAVLMKAICP